MRHGKTVVLSDTHFGDEASLLRERHVLSLLQEKLLKEGEVEEIILLGDTWDLWKRDFASAAVSSKPFFRILSSLPHLLRILVICGNHDHHLYLAANESPRVDKARKQVTIRRPLAGNALLWEDENDILGSMLREALEVPDSIKLSAKYPFHQMKVAGKSVMLMHGHQLDYFASRFWWAKTAVLARWALKRVRGVSAQDIETYNAPFFELLHYVARAPELAEKAYGFYRTLRLLGFLFGISSGNNQSIRRFTSIDENVQELRAMLLQLYPGYLPDIFVFGHIHRAGEGSTFLGSRPLFIYNCGSWVGENGGSAQGSYLVIGDKIILRTLALP